MTCNASCEVKTCIFHSWHSHLRNEPFQYSNTLVSLVNIPKSLNDEENNKKVMKTWIALLKPG